MRMWSLCSIYALYSSWIISTALREDISNSSRQTLTTINSSTSQNLLMNYKALEVSQQRSNKTSSQHSDTPATAHTYIRTNSFTNLKLHYLVNAILQERDSQNSMEQLNSLIMLQLEPKWLFQSRSFIELKFLLYINLFTISF